LDRNLTDKDVLYGTFAKEQLLNGNELVFAAKANEYVGPIETDLGHVIFRIREIIPATSTSYEEVKSTLEIDYKLSESIKIIDTKIEEAQNLLAAGGTLDDLQKEMGFEIEKILFNAEENIPILENKIFYDTAQKAKINDFPEIKELPGGGLFALQVDENVDARLRKVVEISAELTNAWQEQEIQIELDNFANYLLSKNQYKGEILNFNKQTRDKAPPDLPAEIITEVFNLSVEEGIIVSGDQKSYIVRLKDISNADLSSDNAKLLVSQIKNQINNSLSADLFESFATMARVNSKLNLNEQAVNAVHSSFQ
jgi:peptidyl-prolyl cis-trans isomerase D